MGSKSDPVAKTILLLFAQMSTMAMDMNLTTTPQRLMESTTLPPMQSIRGEYFSTSGDPGLSCFSADETGVSVYFSLPQLSCVWWNADSRYQHDKGVHRAMHRSMFRSGFR